MTANSFGSRATLNAAGTAYEIYRLDARAGCGQPPVQPEGPAGEPAPQRGRRQHHRRPHPRPAGGTPRQSRTPRSSSPRRGSSCRTSPASRPSWTWPPCARRCRPWAATPQDQPARPRRARHRPSVMADVFGQPGRVRAQRGDRVRAQPERFSSCAGASSAFGQFKVVPPGTGIVHQVNIEYLARVVMRRDGDGAVGLSGHLRRHRLAHHDAERPRRPRLGRRRHRGRGGHARPADHHADPARWSGSG